MRTPDQTGIQPRASPPNRAKASKRPSRDCQHNQRDGHASQSAAAPPSRGRAMNKLERHNRRLLTLFRLDPARRTTAQIKRGGQLIAIISREPCGDKRPDRKPAAIEAWRKLVNEVRDREALR